MAKLHSKFYFVLQRSFSFSLQLKLYHTVIDDVIAGVRDPFLDDGVDEQVLQELKQVWTSKLMASRAVEIAPDISDSQAPPPVLSNSQKVSLLVSSIFA